ncbi:MAG: hypothetical protein WHX52_22830 [Anaerolineae bacterium]
MKHYTGVLIVGVIVIAMVHATATYAAVVHASDSGWEQDGALMPDNLSHTGDIRQPAIALSDEGDVTVVWSNVGTVAPRGIFAAIGTGTPITPSMALYLSENQDQDAWAPDVAYQDEQLVATWVQGTFPYPGQIMQQDGLTGTPRTVMSPVYGYTTPRLLIGGDRLLLFFASADNENDWSKADLYYAQRPFTVEDWLTPTMIITRAQANPPYGGIWYPHAALNANKDTVHLVWEQTAGTLTMRSVWYIQGVWQASQQDFDWFPPTRLSLADKESVRPKISVDAAQRVHVAWIEQQVVQTGAGTQATLQYVNYRRFENEQWIPPLEQPAQRLDTAPVQVNTYRPTWSNIAIDARGDTICIAWHGYRGAPGVSGQEEILLKCSRDGGKNWGTQTTNASQTPDALSLFPALRLDTHARIHLAWEEHQKGIVYTTNYDTYYRQGPLPRLQIFLPLMMRNYHD